MSNAQMLLHHTMVPACGTLAKSVMAATGSNGAGGRCGVARVPAPGTEGDPQWRHYVRHDSTHDVKKSITNHCHSSFFVVVIVVMFISP